MEKKELLVYGSYGYTGRLIVDEALKNNLQPILSGRDKAKVEAQAREKNLPFRVFDLDDPSVVIKNLQDVKVLLHCAGPFAHTASAMADACMITGTHYLDITGEFQVFEALAAISDKAKTADIVLMPGVGFDVVPSDCLALYLKEKMPIADTLELALLQVGGTLSQGTAITVSENLGEGSVVRRKGKLEKIRQGELQRTIKIDGKERTAVAISWGDVSTAYRSTRIPNITVYNFLPPELISKMKLLDVFSPVFRLGFVKRFMKYQIKKRPAGPNEETRQNAKSVIWGEVKNGLGISRRAKLELPEGYTLTAITAIQIAKSFMEGNTARGYQTPAMVFGSSFITDKVAGSKLTDLN